MIIDPYQKELLYRKAQGNGLRVRYKEKLSALLGIDPENMLFLNLSETDNIIKSLVKRKSIFTYDAEFSTLDECMTHYSSKTFDCEYYLLLDEDWRYCGACVARNANLNPKYDFNRFQSDEIRLISTDFNMKITIDYAEFYDEDFLELRISRYAPA